MQIDLAMVRRLESSAAATTVQLARAMQTLTPEHPADALPMGDGALIAMGPGRYVNRGLGLTLAQLSTTEVDTVEQFYAQRNLPAALELTSWAPPTLVAELTSRGYEPRWFRSMFAIEPEHCRAAAAADVVVEAVDDTNLESWLAVYATAFGVADAARAISDEMALATHAVTDAHVMLATIDGAPAGCGLLHVDDGVAWIGGAATVPQFRRRGVQATLIAHRLRLAVQLGCDLVGATAVPSGQSATNLSRHGFGLVHTQLVVERPMVG